ncbi:MAG: hypothetical protein AB1571_00300 [Nanoarchaeota archaeon]
MKFWFDKKKVIIYLAIILFVLIVLYFYSSENCGTDTRCFDKNAVKCKLTKLTTSNQGNTFLYEIRGSKGDNCIINVKMLDTEASYDVAQKLKGKAMVCSVPKEKLNSEFLSDMDKTLNYCTGPLKESMLELVIEKMYGMIIKNMGDIVLKMQDVLKPT